MCERLSPTVGGVLLVIVLGARTLEVVLTFLDGMELVRYRPATLA